MFSEDTVYLGVDFVGEDGFVPLVSWLARSRKVVYASSVAIFVVEKTQVETHGLIV